MLEFKIWNSETIIILKYLSRLSRYMIIYQQFYILKKTFISDLERCSKCSQNRNQVEELLTTAPLQSKIL